MRGRLSAQGGCGPPGRTSLEAVMGNAALANTHKIKKELSICQSLLCLDLVSFPVLSQIKPQAPRTESLSWLLRGRSYHKWYPYGTTGHHLICGPKPPTVGVGCGYVSPERLRQSTQFKGLTAPRRGVNYFYITRRLSFLVVPFRQYL